MQPVKPTKAAATLSESATQKWIRLGYSMERAGKTSEVAHGDNENKEPSLFQYVGLGLAVEGGVWGNGMGDHEDRLQGHRHLHLKLCVLRQVRALLAGTLPIRPSLLSTIGAHEWTPRLCTAERKWLMTCRLCRSSATDLKVRFPLAGCHGPDVCQSDIR